MIIRANYFGAVFAAFREIDHDHGAINRLEPAKDTYEIPEAWEVVAICAQRHLSQLDAEELTTICCGEQEEARLLAGSRAIPYAVLQLLNAYFNDWLEEYSTPNRVPPEEGV